LCELRTSRVGTNATGMRHACTPSTAHRQRRRLARPCTTSDLWVSTTDNRSRSAVPAVRQPTMPTADGGRRRRRRATATATGDGDGRRRHGDGPTGGPGPGPGVWPPARLTTHNNRARVGIFPGPNTQNRGATECACPLTALAAVELHLPNYWLTAPCRARHADYLPIALPCSYQSSHPRSLHGYPHCLLRYASTHTTPSVLPTAVTVALQMQ
jgi:hypothetical protein